MVNKYQVDSQKWDECASRFITVLSNVITVPYDIITDVYDVITVLYAFISKVFFLTLNPFYYTMEMMDWIRFWNWFQNDIPKRFLKQKKAPRMGPNMGSKF